MLELSRALYWFRSPGILVVIVAIVSIVLAGCPSTETVDTDSNQEPSPSSAPSAISAIGLHELEKSEEAAESLANHLIELSDAIRKGIRAQIQSYFGQSILATRFPSEREDLHRKTETIYWQHWKIEKEAKPISRDQFLDSLDVFMDTFGEIEDLRLKVLKSELAGDGGISASVKFALYGSDHDGLREGVFGHVNLVAQPHDKTGWQISKFEIASLESVRAESAMFTEVAGPAGIGADLPTGLGPANAWPGVAVADIDDDGFLDIAIGGMFLFRSRGDGTFEDVSEQLGIRAIVGTEGPKLRAPVFLDYDQDGDLDLFISGSKNFLLQNQKVPSGNLFYTDASQSLGDYALTNAYSVAVADINGDGFPDLYLGAWHVARGSRVSPITAGYRGDPADANLLFLNQADGSFREVGAAWGVADRRWSYAVGFADIDSDGDQDLIVANDFGGGTRVYDNRGDHFVDIASEVGLGTGNDMGVSFGDYDNDGDLDLHLTEMSSTAGTRILNALGEQERESLESLAAGNFLYNYDSGRFREVGGMLGPLHAGWSWGGGFIDIDNDGWEDLYSPNGFISGNTFKDT